jgi:hypothetical protein
MCLLRPASVVRPPINGSSWWRRFLDALMRALSAGHA